jgi:hypothetical protein
MWYLFWFSLLFLLSFSRQLPVVVAAVSCCCCMHVHWLPLFVWPPADWQWLFVDVSAIFGLAVFFVRLNDQTPLQNMYLLPYSVPSSGTVEDLLSVTKNSLTGIFTFLLLYSDSKYGLVNSQRFYLFDFIFKQHGYMLPLSSTIVASRSI